MQCGAHGVAVWGAGAHVEARDEKDAPVAGPAVEGVGVRVRGRVSKP